jgi:hypothetical protein
MKVSDIELSRISRLADRSHVLLDGEAQQNQGFKITRIEMRQYIEHIDECLGEYSLLTILIETDEGTLEMKYDEGFRGPNALDSAVILVTQYIGLAALINRALIELQRLKFSD